MTLSRNRGSCWLAGLALAAFGGTANGACCYFSAKNADILQPAQKVFLTYDPAEKVETFTAIPGQIVLCRPGMPIVRLVVV